MSVERLETLLAEAAPGPWRIDPHSPVNIVGPTANIIGIRHDGGQSGGEYPHTGQLIALAPTLARLVIDMAAELRKDRLGPQSPIHGHHPRCSLLLTPGTDFCDCGHDELAALLARVDALNEQDDR